MKICITCCAQFLQRTQTRMKCTYGSKTASVESQDFIGGLAAWTVASSECVKVGDSSNAPFGAGSFAIGGVCGMSSATLFISASSLHALHLVKKLAMPSKKSPIPEKNPAPSAFSSTRMLAAETVYTNEIKRTVKNRMLLRRRRKLNNDKEITIGLLTKVDLWQ
jgi:hypothetical protein